MTNNITFNMLALIQKPFQDRYQQPIWKYSSNNFLLVEALLISPNLGNKINAINLLSCKMHQLENHRHKYSQETSEKVEHLNNMKIDIEVCKFEENRKKELIQHS